VSKKRTELKLITDPPSVVEEACLKLDTAIDKCLSSIRDMKRNVSILKKIMDHPFHTEALDNITGLLDEALIPYLDDIDKEFRNIVAE